MPKYPTDRRQYYTDNMGDSGRPMSRERARGRSSSQQRDDRQSSSQHHGTETISSRRPGEPSQQGSHAPYHRPTGTTSSYASSARGEMRSEHRPSSAFSEATSDTTSNAGSTGGNGGNGGNGNEPVVGRGGMRGRRVLPVDIITRPRHLQTKHGGFGKKVTLQANYFKLLSTTDWCLYKYAVDFAPIEDRTFVKKSLIRQCKEQLGTYLYDGSVLYTSARLPDPLQLTGERKDDSQLVTMTIKNVGDMNRGDHHYIQVFNIIMRKCLDFLKLRLVGRNYFDPVNKVDIKDWKLELWPGYDTSIRQHEHDILMCAEITHKVMRCETLLDILSDCYETNKTGYQEVFSRTVMGTVVLTAYNNNTYRVDDVDYNLTPLSTFKLKNGDEISYMNYYQTKYGIRIRDQRQPLLVSRAKARDRRAGQSELVILVPELCRSTGLTDNMRSNFRLMQALAQHTRVSPNDRMKKLMRFNDRLYKVPDIVNEFKSWNLTLDKKLVDIPARVLPPEVIGYGRGATSDVPYNASWQTDMRNKELLSCGQLNEWVVVVPSRLKRDCQNFVTCLIKVAGGMNFVIQQPYVFELPTDHASAYAEMLELVKSKQNPMLIFCVATNNRMDRYSAIKKKCCVDRPVPTQVVLAKSLQAKSVMSIATKVAIQMNCKIGGIPWKVSIPMSCVMVVGFDVCHDTNSKTKDYGAMVASLDSNFGRYFSAVSSHTSGEELSNDLSVNLCKALHQFKQYNQCYPKKIIIYRDGVGDGQIPHVLEHEVKQVKEKLHKLYGNPDDVKMAYIIVTKRVSTRFFCNGQNPSPGTVVDDVVTDPSRYDFFIVSQHVGQGTVSPTSYNVIEDTSGLDADKIQRLTYKLCHMYFNWSGTVRVPAPCQYAHKLAFLVSQAVHQSPDPILETLLYFL